MQPEDWPKTHSIIQFWDTHKDQLRAWASGSIRRRELDEALLADIKTMAFISINETSIEGNHALVKCRMNRRGHSHPLPQLFSTELRYNEF